MPTPRLGRAFPSARFDYPSVSSLHLVDLRQYRNFYRLSIIYAFRPRLRSRLTPGGRTFPGKPQTLDGEVSRLSLATYAGILSSIQSTAPYRYCFFPYTMLLYQCTSTFLSFGSVFQPRTFSAQDLSTSELLRTLLMYGCF